MAVSQEKAVVEARKDKDGYLKSRGVQVPASGRGERTRGDWARERKTEQRGEEEG